MTARLPILGLLFYIVTCSSTNAEILLSPHHYILRAITLEEYDTQSESESFPQNTDSPTPQHDQPHALNVLWKTERIAFLDIGNQLDHEGRGLRLEAIIAWKIPSPSQSSNPTEAQILFHLESAPGFGLWGSVVACVEVLSTLPDDLTQLLQTGFFQKCSPIYRAGDPVPGAVNFAVEFEVPPRTEQQSEFWFLLRLAPARETISESGFDLAEDDFVRFYGGEIFAPQLRLDF